MSPPTTAEKITLSFTLNGVATSLEVDPERTLLWVLRTDLGLTGPKYGCGLDQCGACTVLVDHRKVRACSVPVKAVAGKEVITIEGLARDGRLHPLQEAFMQNDALQCGFCTPGMILTAYAFLRNHPAPTREEIVGAMEGNLCRCGAHARIVDAIAQAAQAMHGGKTP